MLLHEEIYIFFKQTQHSYQVLKIHIILIDPYRTQIPIADLTLQKSSATHKWNRASNVILYTIIKLKYFRKLSDTFRIT